MQWVAHDNTDPDNVWAIPADIIAPVVSITLLIAYRRLGGPEALPPADARAAGRVAA